MSAKQAAVIRQAHLNARDPQREQLVSGEQDLRSSRRSAGGIDRGAREASQDGFLARLDQIACGRGARK